MYLKYNVYIYKCYYLCVNSELYSQNDLLFIKLYNIALITKGRLELISYVHLKSFLPILFYKPIDTEITS